MGSDIHRQTVLPGQLWPEKVSANLPEGDVNGTDESLSISFKSGEANLPSRLRKTHKETRENLDQAPKKRSPTKYHTKYVVDQAGPATIALKDTEKLPICLLKNHGSTKPGFSQSLPFVSHKNLLSLIDHFEFESQLYLVYEYEHFAISLGCVAGTVRFSEADMATICRESLEGLKYIHSVLKTPYCLLNPSNILLTWQGEIKLANIGESLLRKPSNGTTRSDIQDVGSILVFFIDRNASLLEPGSESHKQTPSRLALSFIENTKKKDTVELIMRDEFLNLANPAGAWSLKPYYFETLPFGIHIGSRAS